MLHLSEGGLGLYPFGIIAVWQKRNRIFQLVKSLSADASESVKRASHDHNGTRSAAPSVRSSRKESRCVFSHVSLSDTARNLAKDLILQPHSIAPDYARCIIGCAAFDRTERTGTFRQQHHGKRFIARDAYAASADGLPLSCGKGRTTRMPQP